MKEAFNLKKALIVSLVALGFIVLAVYCVEVTNSRDALRGTLASTQGTLTVAQAELVSVHGELTSTETELASTQTELTSVKGDLTSAEVKLASVRSDLVSTETELLSTRNTLALTHSTLTATELELTSTQRQLVEVAWELDVAQETLAGLGITISTSDQNYDADLVDNPEAVNPTWDELVGFLASDRTESNEYIAGVYDCSEFSRDVHNNAESAGIRAAVVHDHLKYSWFDHALNAFLTTDYGLVYVDCAGAGVDTIAYVESGKMYKAVGMGEVSPENVRNAAWWDGLEPWEHYYLSGWVCIPYSICYAATDHITIFW